MKPHLAQVLIDLVLKTGDPLGHLRQRGLVALAKQLDIAFIAGDDARRGAADNGRVVEAVTDG